MPDIGVPLTQGTLAAVLMLVLACIIAGLVAYVVIAYDDPALWGDDDEQDYVMVLEPPYDQDSL